MPNGVVLEIVCRPLSQAPWACPECRRRTCANSSADDIAPESSAVCEMLFTFEVLVTIRKRRATKLPRRSRWVGLKRSWELRSSSGPNRSGRASAPYEHPATWPPRSSKIRAGSSGSRTMPGIDAAPLCAPRAPDAEHIGGRRRSAAAAAAARAASVVRDRRRDLAALSLVRRRSAALRAVVRERLRTARAGGGGAPAVDRSLPLRHDHSSP